MSASHTFRCGHPMEPANISAQGDRLRCRTCRLARRKAKNPSSRRGQPDFGIYEVNQRQDLMRQASKLLHRALYRSHPYVFDAAEKAGRQVVRP